MCLYPKKIVNPSRFVDLNSNQPLYLYVPCGHCTECISSYRSEWRNRAYYEVLDTFSYDNSYVYFDCLTYRPGALPHLSDFYGFTRDMMDYDFPCFNPDHVQKFMKSLRRRLEYLGYDVKYNLRFFLASEYGTDIRYTKRPHYHVLFFVRNSCVPYDVLSREVAHVWHYGRTDGLPYKTRSYVRGNVFGDRFSSINRVCSYVTKYVTKDFGYSDMVKARLDACKALDFTFYERVKDYVRMFHRQSKSFGHNYFDRVFGASYLVSNLTIPVVNKDHVTIHVAPHRSLVRHCLQKFQRFGKRVKWYSTPEFCEFNARIAPSRVTRLAVKMSNGDPIKYPFMRKVATDVLYRNYRFGDVSDVRAVCYNEHNDDDVGLRNYSSRDYEFVQRKVFAFNDYGSVSDGFTVDNRLRFVDGVPHHDGELTWFSNVEKLCYLDTKSNELFDSFLSDTQLQPDEGIAVMKLVERMNYIHKSKLIV